MIVIYLVTSLKMPWSHVVQKEDTLVVSRTTNLVERRYKGNKDDLGSRCVAAAKVGWGS